MKLYLRRYVTTFQWCLPMLFCCVFGPQVCMAKGQSTATSERKSQAFHAAGKKSVVAWQYDPSLQPITLTEIRRIIRSPKTTPAMHGLVTSRAYTSRLLEYAVEEYDKRHKTQPNNPVLQCAFGSAVISVNQFYYKPSNEALRRKQQESTFTQEAVHAIENAVKGAGTNISFCQAVYGYMRVTAFPSLVENEAEYKQGLDALERAIQLDPKGASSYGALASAYLTKNKLFNPQRSLDLARKATLLNPKYSSAYYTQAIALYQLKRPEEAKPLIIKSWTLLPPNLRPKPPTRS